MRIVRTTLTYAMLLLVTFFTLGPLLWIVSASFKPNNEITQPGLGNVVPNEPTVQHYAFLAENVEFSTFITNTVYVSAMTGLLTVLVSAMGGYALAKYEFRGKAVVTGIVLATMLLPPVLLLAPLFRLIQTLHMIDTYWALIIPPAASGFGVLIMRQYMHTVPAALLDSGRLDGAGEFRIFWSIVLPLVRPILSALLIFTFLTAWNAYLWPIIVLRDENNYLLTVAVTNVVASAQQENYGVVMAGTVISIAPIIVLFLALQREFISGLTLGAVKQ
jgi:ABC-type glycerol-3-phosphate transport system permease component